MSSLRAHVLAAGLVAAGLPLVPPMASSLASPVRSPRDSGIVNPSPRRAAAGRPLRCRQLPPCQRSPSARLRPRRSASIQGTGPCGYRRPGPGTASRRRECPATGCGRRRTGPCQNGSRNVPPPPLSVTGPAMPTVSIGDAGGRLTPLGPRERTAAPAPRRPRRVGRGPRALLERSAVSAVTQ